MTAQTGEANGPAPALDEELLLWPGDEPLAVRAADAERICEIPVTPRAASCASRRLARRSPFVARCARLRIMRITG